MSQETPITATTLPLSSGAYMCRIISIEQCVEITSILITVDKDKDIGKLKICCVLETYQRFIRGVGIGYFDSLSINSWRYHFNH